MDSCFGYKVLSNLNVMKEIDSCMLGTAAISMLMRRQGLQMHALFVLLLWPSVV